jgi:7-cyano-7-deazaguanine synthase in queuosine biosynthesis
MKPLEQFKLIVTDHRKVFDEKLFVGGQDFRLNYHSIVDSLLVPLPPRIADLLRIAGSIHFIDRLVVRDRKHGPNYWPRKISCRVEVREPEFWKSSSVSKLLHDALCFVSGDIWTLDFIASTATERCVTEWQRPLGILWDDPIRVCLYSGGLDSAAGLANQIVAAPAPTTIAVNVQHRSDLGSTANDQLKMLGRHFGTQIQPLVVPFEMATPATFKVSEETSQRARSFLFVSIGGAIAALTGSSALEVYESGIGSINLPLLAGMSGSQATRGSHPKFLRLMSALLGHVANRPIDVVLPFANYTKGEVVRALKQMDQTDLIKSTISCVHYPIRTEKGEPWKSCGICPGCIFRRIALSSVGIEENPKTYEHDIFNSVFKLNHKTQHYLMAFLLQIDNLAEIDTGHLPRMIVRHLETTDALGPQTSPQEIKQLYSRYLLEWRSVLREARKNGCGWASRIDLPVQAA